MPNADFYRARADEERLAADAARLANVRERCLRSAAAWEVMADRAARTAHHRDEEAVRRAMREDGGAPIASAAAFAGRGDG